MKTPYTTKSGLQIGLLYKHGTPVYHDADALRLQSRLLRKPRGPIVTPIRVATALVYGLAVVVVLLDVFVWRAA